MTSRPAPDITLYTTQTPNGIKISIALEELGLPYKVHNISFSKNEQKEPWFLAINPNGRIPAITDKTFKNNRTRTTGDIVHAQEFEEIHVWESGAILQYLVETYDKEHLISYEKGTREYWEVQEWLFFQNAGVGPMQGQANHFVRYAPEKIPYSITRYTTETVRLYNVIEAQLSRNSAANGGGGFLVGDRLTIADIALYGWVRSAGWAGVDVEAFPRIKEWEEKLEVREGFRKGRDVPEPNRIKELVLDRGKAEEAARSAREWIVGAGEKKL